MPRPVTLVIAAAAAAAVAAVVVAGCAGDGGSGTAATSSTSAPAGATTTLGARPLAPPTSRAGVTPTTEAARLPCRTPRRQSGPTYQIAARDNFFEPACMALSSDQGVNVVNEGTVTHNFTLQQVAAGGERTEVIDFGNLEPGQNTATEAFDNMGPGAGVYRLYCKIHEAEGMEAFLEVT